MFFFCDVSYYLVTWFFVVSFYFCIQDFREQSFRVHVETDVEIDCRLWGSEERQEQPVCVFVHPCTCCLVEHSFACPLLALTFVGPASDYILFGCRSPIYFVLQNQPSNVVLSIASAGSILGGSSANTEGQARSLARRSSIRAVTFNCRGLHQCDTCIRFDAITSLGLQLLLCLCVRATIARE